MSERINQHLNPLVGNNGYNNPTVDMLVALTKIFECDFNEFFKTEWEQFYYMIIYVDCSHFFVQ